MQSRAHIESALETITSITEMGRYLKNGKKEEILKAVSVLKNCFDIITNTAEEENSEKNNEVKEQQTQSTVSGDVSRTTGQVAPSIGSTQKASDYIQPLQTPSVDPHNLSAPRPTTSPAQQSKIIAHENDKLADINGRLDNIMDFLSNKLNTIIEEKISQTLTQKAITTNRENEHYNTTDREDICEGQQKEPKWATVTDRRNKQTPNQPTTVRGTRKENNSDLEAAEKMAWLYLGNLKKNTTTEKVKKYLESNGIQDNIECEELHTIGDKKAFKIGFPFKFLGSTDRPDFWPQGIVVRRFRFRKTQSTEGIELPQ